MSNFSKWARKALGLPEVNIIPLSTAHVLVQVVTPAVARQIVEKLPDAELDALYTAATTEQIRRKAVQGGQAK